MPISKVFREIGLADELGSGMRNTYKYTKIYSGGEPKFEEGDIFHITIPLSELATATVGPTSSRITAEAGAEASAEAVTIKLDDERLAILLEFCKLPRTKSEMQECCGIKSERYFRKNILTPMIQKGLIKRTIPAKPKSPKQKYITK